MPATYEPIATYTFASAGTEIVFSSISQNYTDIVVVFNGSRVTGQDLLMIRFNGDTNTNYSRTTLLGNGTSASSGRSTNQGAGYIGDISSSQISTNIAYVMNYSNSTTNKTVLTRSSKADQYVEAEVNLWRSTSAITSIQIAAQGTNNIASGSTVTLYGIKSF